MFAGEALDKGCALSSYISVATPHFRVITGRRPLPTVRPNSPWQKSCGSEKWGLPPIRSPS